MEEENKIQTKNKDDLQVLRTYTSDMADAVRTNEASVIKIALAEKEKREQEIIYKKAEGTNFSKILLIVGGIIFIVAAIFGSMFLTSKKKERETPVPIKNNIETFISYDSYTYLDVTKATNVSELSNIIKQENFSNSGLIKVLLLTKKIGEITETLTSKNFLSIIKTNMPGALNRSLSDKYLLGKYNVGGEGENPILFLVFETTNYTQAYASMLDWEKNMLRDLFVILDLKIEGSNNQIFENPWKDIIINNRDARVIYGDMGEGILYYAFINKNNLVITSNLETMKEIISRLIIKNAS